MAPRLTTCAPWCTVDDLPADVADEDSDYLEQCIALATTVLFEFTGRRWPGECDDVIRPFTCGCAGPSSCGCEPSGQLELPRRPVIDVTQVRVDGEVIDPDLYRVDGDRWLVYLDEEAPDDALRGWPSAQRLKREPTEEQTFEVQYSFGTLPPDGANLIAGALAAEFVKAFNPDPEQAKGCRLPRRVQTVSRQGVSIAVIDPLTLFDEGRTGIAEIDMWVAAKNRGRHDRVGSVHIPRPRRSADWRARRNG